GLPQRGGLDREEAPLLDEPALHAPRLPDLVAELHGVVPQRDVRDERGGRRDDGHAPEDEEARLHAASLRGTRRAARSLALRERGFSRCSSSPATTGRLVSGVSRSLPRK